VAVAALAAYVVLSLARWYRMDPPSWDLAIFEQVVKGYANLGPPIVNIKGVGFNALGDHFSPILILLAPFYRLFPTPVTLLVAQCVAVAVSVLPVMWTARRHLGNRPAVFLGCAYAVSWGLQSGVDVQFHEYSLGVPLMAMAVAGLVDGRWRAAGFWALSLLLVKEDLAFTVTFMGLAMMGHAWARVRRARREADLTGSVAAGVAVAGGADDGDMAERQPSDPVGARADGAADTQANAMVEARTGALLAAGGLVAMALVFFVIVPHFNPEGGWDYWQNLGDGQEGGIDWWKATFGLLTPAVKVNTLVLLAALTVGASCRSWLMTLVVPTLLWRFAGSTEFYWGTTWHYSMILMPIVFLAGVDALVRLRRSKSSAVRRYARLVPALAALFGLISCVYFPLGKLVQAKTYSPSPRAEQAQAVLNAIPSGASVASDFGLLPYLTANHTVYWLGPLDHGVQPDWVLIDPSSGWNDDPGDAAKYAESTYPGSTYQDVPIGTGDAGYRLAKRVG
jgi:uncharacterized membrane protein